MKRSLRVGKGAFSTLLAGEERSRLLWTVPKGASFTAQILCDAAHIISGDLCHYYLSDEKELVWAYCGPGDPCVALDVAPRYSLIIPMLIKVDDKKKVQRNVRFPKSVGRQVESLALSAPSIENLIVKVTRDDSGEWVSYSLESAGAIASSTSYPFDQNEWVDGIISTIFEGSPGAVSEWLKGNGVTISGHSEIIEEIDF